MSVSPATTVSGVVDLWCGPCGSAMPFEAPPCQDGHGEDCLDLCCVVCGSAVVVGVWLVPADVVLDARAA